MDRRISNASKLGQVWSGTGMTEFFRRMERLIFTNPLSSLLLNISDPRTELLFSQPSPMTTRATWTNSTRASCRRNCLKTTLTKMQKWKALIEDRKRLNTNNNTLGRTRLFSTKESWCKRPAKYISEENHGRPVLVSIEGFYFLTGLPTYLLLMMSFRH